MWEEIRDDPSIRCTIITGAGDKHFCTGADVDNVAAAGKVRGEYGSIRNEVHHTSRQNEVWKPTVCAVNGMVARGGLYLRMTLQGRNYRLSADRAFQLGLVEELCPRADLDQLATSIAEDICKNSPNAVSLSMRSVWMGREMPYSQAIDYGYSLLRMHWRHPDFKEGPRAFGERRDPQWFVAGETDDA